MTQTTNKIVVKEKSRNVHEFRMNHHPGFEQWFLLSSDHHFDNPKADRELIFRHLKEAKERDARVFMFGDFFCLMQGKADRRGNKADILPQHNNAQYIDAVINEGIDLLGEYAENIALITPGNHETAMIKFHETNPTERLVQGLNSKFNPDEKVFMGGYSGFVRFMFSQPDNGGMRMSKKLFYHHGHGGGGPVTKGIIQSQRRSSYVDSDFVVSGHVHESVTSEWPKVELTPNGKIKHYTQHHIILPTYKEEYVDGFGGWHVERGAGPKPLGAYWLRFYWKNGEIQHDIIRAK